jgi:hypothetical protein
MPRDRSALIVQLGRFSRRSGLIQSSFTITVRFAEHFLEREKPLILLVPGAGLEPACP